MNVDIGVVDMSDLESLIEQYKVAAGDAPAGVVVPPGTVFASGEDAVDAGTIPVLFGMEVIVSELLPSNSIYVLNRADVDRFRRFQP